jgi:hypothetical protein
VRELSLRRLGNAGGIGRVAAGAAGEQALVAAQVGSRPPFAATAETGAYVALQGSRRLARHQVDGAAQGVRPVEQGCRALGDAQEARNLEAMSAYYRDIQRLDGFSEVVLRTHQTNFQDPDKPVRFRITLKWNVQP